MIRALLLLLGLFGALFFAHVFQERYWLFRGCFGDEGRCYDPETEQVLLPIAGPLWGSCSLTCLGLAALAAFTGRQTFRQHSGSPRPPGAR
jgi:hypothetical protein